MAATYMLAEKLKNQYYIRDEAMRCSFNSYNTRGRRRAIRPMNGIRLVQKRKNLLGRVADSVRSGSRKAMPITPAAEMTVKKQVLNPIFIAALVFVTLMMIALVVGFSQVYETANVVSELEAQLETLETEKSDLALELEEKTDLRMVETVATTKLGMVKEDSLQKKFVSLSDGERIVVAETEETVETTTGGVVLSSVLSSIGKFFDNFR